MGLKHLINKSWNKGIRKINTAIHQNKIEAIHLFIPFVKTVSLLKNNPHDINLLFPSTIGSYMN